MTTNRSDIHRPGAIQPDQYRHFASYDVGGVDEPSFNMPVVRDIVSKARENGKHVFGCPGKCGVCGATFRYGDVWMHEPTGDLVHFGHTCTEKYSMLADDPAFCAHLEALKRNRAARIEEKRADDRFAFFCAKHDGLAEDFTVDHRIVQDIKRKLRKYGSISDAQINLVRKLATEVRNPKPAPEPEQHVAAPVSDERVKIQGRVVSVKVHEGFYGPSLKMTVKVETPNGSWLCWGTVPSKEDDIVKGAVIAFEAKLQSGDTPHFAFFKRPTKVQIIEPAPAEGVAA